MNIDGKMLFAINVAALPYSLACVFSPSKPEYLRYPYRTEYGKKYLKVYEIEGRMNDFNRSIFLKLAEIWKRDKEIQLLSPFRSECF